MAVQQVREVVVAVRSNLNSPRLSIIVPMLNERKGLQTFLASLQSLRQSGVELIIVDGGSHDGTCEALHLEYASMTDKVLSSARGRAHQMNSGAHASQGEVLLFLHADTVLPPDTLHLLDMADLAGTQGWGCFNVRLNGRHPAFRVIEWFMSNRSRITGIATGDQAIVISRSLFDSLGGYSALPLMEDIDLCRRLRHVKSPKRITGTVVTSSRRWEVNGIVKTVLLMWWLRLAYFMGVPAERLWQYYRKSPR